MERLVSTMDDIESKRKNRFGTEKTKDSVFVSTNMCLIKVSSIRGNASENLLGLHKEKSFPPIVDKDDEISITFILCLHTPSDR